MSEKRLFGLVCQTALQGLTISLGDIYLTKEAAEAEHADLRRMRPPEPGEVDDDEDTGFDVIEIVVGADGEIRDTFGQLIIVQDARDNADVLHAVAELYQSIPLNELQQSVLKSYAGGEFSHLETIGQTRGTECGDTLVQFLMAEAADAGGDPEQLATQLGTAIRQLQDLQHELLYPTNNEQQRG